MHWNWLGIFIIEPVLKLPMRKRIYSHSRISFLAFSLLRSKIIPKNKSNFLQICLISQPLPTQSLIPQSKIEEILNAALIEEVVGESVRLKRRG
ncbi:MAG: hypothetical protein K9J84_14125, partial [Bacteroidia bacterium]|nr:hypothetical protein [Bacteroidia bacterium]